MDVLSKLGSLLALSNQSIQEIVKPQKVYCLLFGEKNENPHFHLFLGTKELKQEYESLFNIRPDGAISGPDLFSWITKHKHCLNSQAGTISHKIKNFLLDYQSKTAKEKPLELLFRKSNPFQIVVELV